MTEKPAPDPCVPSAAVPPRLRALWRRYRWLDAPIAATLAAAVHFAWNVPDRVVVVPGDQGVPKPKHKGRSRGGAHRPRPVAQLARLAQTYRDKAFSAEPKAPEVARYVVPRLRRVVTHVRGRVFEKAPSPPTLTVTDYECRTVRCRFHVAGARPYEVQLLADGLRELSHGGKRQFVGVRVLPEVGADGTGAWIEVTLARDDLQVPIPRVRGLPGIPGTKTDRSTASGGGRDGVRGPRSRGHPPRTQGAADGV